MPGKTITKSAILAGFLLASGCATMNEQECRSADWYSVGFEDGASGRPVSYISGHREACAEYGIAPAAGRYQQGWSEGIRRYCTPLNGYRAGLRGQSLQTACPADLRLAFHEAYRYGQRIHLAEGELADIDREIRARERALDEVRQERERIERRLITGGGSGETRQEKLQAQLRQLYHREDELEAALAELNGNHEAPGSGQRQKEPGRVWDMKGEADQERSSPVKREDDKRRKALEQELAAVRQAIRQLESRLGRELEQERWKLLQQSRELSGEERHLHRLLRRLARERLELEQQIGLLRQQAPY